MITNVYRYVQQCKCAVSVSDKKGMELSPLPSNSAVGPTVVIMLLVALTLSGDLDSQAFSLAERTRLSQWALMGVELRMTVKK